MRIIQALFYSHLQFIADKVMEPMYWKIILPFMA